MMHFDSLRNPVSNGSEKGAGPSRKATEASQNFLSSNPYQELNDEDLTDVSASGVYFVKTFNNFNFLQAKELLKTEMEKVKEGMGHDLSFDAYTQVWEECLSQVLFVASQNKYTRASLASKKDRLESASHQLETNRAHMAKEAKKAAKLEKKLRTLTAGI